MGWDEEHRENPLDHIGEPVEVDYDTGEVTPLRKEDGDDKSRTHEVPDEAEERLQ